MAWTSPRTWVGGEIVNETQMNTYARDNLNYLFSQRPTAWVTPTHADTNYAGDVAGNADWVVDSGDVGTHIYSIEAKIYFLHLYIVTSTIANSPRTLFLTCAGSPVWASTGFVGSCTYFDGSYNTGTVYVGAGSGYLNIWKDDLTTVWGNQTNTFMLSTFLKIPIQ